MAGGSGRGHGRRLGDRRPLVHRRPAGLSPPGASPGPPARWFVTGTDTGVGKSVVTACLAAALRGRVLAAKPLATGVDGGPGEDASLLAFGAGHAPLTHTTWATPVSPHRAALEEGRALDAPALRAWLDGLRAERVLVEGVGGWRVPLALAPRLELDAVARWVGGPVLVVAADRLGVLNHTRLTVEAVRSSGLRVAGVVLNRAHPVDASTSWNLEDLRVLLDVPVAPLERVDLTDLEALAAAGRALWRALGAPDGAPEPAADDVVSCPPGDRGCR